ncbi:hypothetical protein M5K25_017505 [Dendrobium thyrsiflorum]|uniref:Mitochondrial intermembrane space import and assembly protein 40 homolog n=1 Tax=Dendrobium thyrsiflorum TaxID=117978 RepID=A0ABD0UV71_DENTH
MVDPKLDLGFVFNDQGLVDIHRSPFFDIDFENNHIIKEYMDEISFSLAIAIDHRRPPVQWQLTYSPPTTSFPEATAEGGDENETLDQKAQRALECPCVADLRKGPCGSQFSEAFVCFIKSTAEEKGSDCVSPFVALQNCIRSNPDAFSKDVLEDEDQEEEVQEYKFYPPSWSKEPQSKI